MNPYPGLTEYISLASEVHPCLFFLSHITGTTPVIFTATTAKHTSKYLTCIDPDICQSVFVNYRRCSVHSTTTYRGYLAAAIQRSAYLTAVHAYARLIYRTVGYIATTKCIATGSQKIIILVRIAVIIQFRNILMCIAIVPVTYPSVIYDKICEAVYLTAFSAAINITGYGRPAVKIAAIFCFRSVTAGFFSKTKFTYYYIGLAGNITCPFISTCVIITDTAAPTAAIYVTHGTSFNICVCPGNSIVTSGQVIVCPYIVIVHHTTVSTAGIDILGHLTTVKAYVSSTAYRTTGNIRPVLFITKTTGISVCSAEGTVIHISAHIGIQVNVDIGVSL